ncbi:MAG: glycosyltransferase [Deltaproteobacteria bacterium]|nr:glycosyltransferase [Deltaproteobacteria bacterium]
MAREPGSASLHLGIALSAFVIFGIAQLYAFAQMVVLADRTGGGRSLVVALSASAFLAFTMIALVRQALLMLFAYSGATSAARRKLDERAQWPAVSILVPAYNEAGRIEKAIESLLALDYPGLEAIVVDDGSKDDTLARAMKYAGKHGDKRVRVLHKENGGKWSALNLAFHEASSDLLVCVDADSQLEPDSLKLLARHFDDQTLGGCCGQVSVRNTVNLVTRLQAFEYMQLNGLARQAQSTFSSVLVAPGPIAMFRRKALSDVWMSWGTAQALPIVKPGSKIYGPWEHDTFAEDADLTMNILLTGMGVTYEPRAISRTSAPETTTILLNQRYRWTRGNYQAALKAWRRWSSAPRAPKTLPIWLGSLLFETLLWPAVNLAGILGFIALVVCFGIHGPLIAWFLALTIIDLNAAAFSARIERSDMRLLWLSLVSRVYFNTLLDVSKGFALFDEFRGRGMSWS